MGLWYPEIVNRVTKSNGSDSATICEVLRGIELPEENLLFEIELECNDHVTSDVFVYVIALGSIYTFLYLAISTMLQKFSRGYILVINLLISGVSGMLLVFINEPYFVDSPAESVGIRYQAERYPKPAAREETTDPSRCPGHSREYGAIPKKKVLKSKGAWPDKR
ncbi:AAEL002742-PA [Aedes aegypti]|uniref:AAEL002742-PA n=1 Tax=Aedes aegypti TaxID=7159 RepID=Q17HA6_AEDAE|nr:AAEL002742-PA [Aedes aegypti]